MCPQTPYDYNMRTTQGYSMIMLAAEYGRHDVLQYLLDSLSEIFEDDSRVNILIEQEVQATKVVIVHGRRVEQMKDTLKVPTLQVCMV